MPAYRNTVQTGALLVTKGQNAHSWGHSHMSSQTEKEIFVKYSNVTINMSSFNIRYISVGGLATNITDTQT